MIENIKLAPQTDFPILHEHHEYVFDAYDEYSYWIHPEDALRAIEEGKSLSFIIGDDISVCIRFTKKAPRGLRFKDALKEAQKQGCVDYDG